jgi:hypothetical protein
MFRVPYTPIIRSTIFQLYLQPLVQTIVSSELLAPSVAWYKIVLLIMGIYGTRNMWSERSSEIKLTAYSCVCWLLHRIEEENYKRVLPSVSLNTPTYLKGCREKTTYREYEK